MLNPRFVRSHEGSPDAYHNVSQNLETMKEKIGKESVCEVAKQQAGQDYQNWKVEHEGYGYQRLEDRRSQEIVRLLMSGILKKAPAPTGREVKERSVVIDMDALEVGTTLPENLDVLCAQLSPFVFWTGQKKEILLLDYERMDKYLLRHQADITEDARYAYDYFDTIVNLIQEDMALLKPQLAKYLKNYDENLLERSRKECIDVVNACQPLLKANIRTYEEKKPLTEEEMKLILSIADEMIARTTVPCTGCHYCVTKCPKKLDIPFLLKLYNEAMVAGSGDFIAPMALSALDADKQPECCIRCHSCRPSGRDGLCGRR